jgi:hypothetical protein
LPFNKEQYKALTQGVADLESGGKYDIAGGAGGRYLGRYQMGPAEIKQSAEELGVTPPSETEFRKNPALQERLYERYTLDHYNQMMKDAAFASASTEKKLQALGAAQLGVPAGLKWLHGSETADAWGTKTSAWANAVARREKEMGSAVNAAVPSGAISPGAEPSPSGAAARAFIMHHTAMSGSAQDIVNFWKKQGKGYGAQYIMDRQGKVHDTLKEFGYGGTNEILNDPTRGLSNKNVVGMEIIAKDDSDVTQAQAAAAAAFIRKTYPNIAVYGHGQVNPGHKEATEGQKARLAVEADRARAVTAAAPRRPSRPTSRNAPQNGEGPQTMLTNPLGLGNWQMTQRTAFEMRNKTGSDVFIAASTMAS